MLKKIGVSIGAIAVSAVVAGWAIGPDWRALLSDLPSSARLLEWSHSQRTAGLRMLDRLPLLSDSRVIEVGDHVRELPTGKPLDWDFDFDTYFEAQDHAGLVVIHNGEIRLERYGLGFEEDGRWTSFSVAKSITSTLVGAAVKDGYIKSLDDKVSDYIEGLKGSSYDDVTIEQLLTMRSGVQWNEDYADPKADVALFFDYEADDGLSNVTSYMKKLPRAHPAGEKWHYSTGETNLIGVLISKSTGKSLAEYASEKIWKPFGMQQKATWLIGSDGIELAGCCVQAATRDFARIGQFMLEGAAVGGESIVPEGWIEKATTKQADTGTPNEGYGYQWWTFDDGPYQAGGLYGQGMHIDPTRNLVIATNSSWKTTQGNGEDQGQKLRTEFYNALKAAIDKENAL